MYRMYGMSQGARDGGVTMYRMYGQTFAPAISALPPSMVRPADICSMQYLHFHHPWWSYATRS